MTKKGANAPFFVYSSNATEQPLKIAQWYTLNATARETGSDKI